MTYYDDIAAIARLTADQQAIQLARLLEGCPQKLSWPDGMPGSFNPKLVIIGVSPGNSPDGDNSTKWVSTPSTAMDRCTSNFYYEDRTGYWEKVRCLASAFVSHQDSVVREEGDALLLTSHFNLGIDASGSANADCVGEQYVHWVSRILNHVLEPDLVVLFGLVGIFQRNAKVVAWWNEGDGLRVDWKQPTRLIPYPTPNKMYRFREWSLSNALGHTFRLVMWPNHPSRFPFTKSMDSWKRSVDTYLEAFAETKQ